MKYRVAAYYKDFCCIGSACEATCCGGWGIEIDAKSYDRYQTVPGDFGRRLRAGIDHKNRVFHLCKRKCSFLNQDGLCDIYKKLGQEGLCIACKNFPRHMEDYGVLREVMLSLACPEAARLILNDPEQGIFLEKNRQGNVREDVDLPLLKVLEEVRHTMTAMMKNRSLHINCRLAMVLAFAHDVQRRLDGAAGLPLEALIRRYSAGNAAERFLIKVRPYECRWEERIIRMNAFLRESAVLEPIITNWREQQMSICSRLYHHQSREQYRQHYQLFAEATGKQELLWENLMFYFINTYVLGAIYDRDVYSKAKLAVFSWLLIREQVFAAFSQSIGQGQAAADWLPAMLTQAAWRYAREVENLDENLNTLEHGFRKNGLFSLDSMLTVLLGAPV